jgi:lysophospholipase L1-like esterase
VVIDGVFIGLQSSGAMLVPGSNMPVAFGGKASVVIAPGAAVISDPLSLPYVRNPDDVKIANRKLAVSFHVAGESGPISWHAGPQANTYLTAPQAGAKGGDETEAAYPYQAPAWFFLDEVQMNRAGPKAIVALGDSLTDGLGSTSGGDDRWTDVLSRRVHQLYGEHFSVLNAGISGNMITAAGEGGPSAVERFTHDVIDMPNVSTVVWLQGINDFALAGANPDQVADSVRLAVRRFRTAKPDAKLFMGTLTSALGSVGAHGTQEVEAKRQAFNRFIRTTDIFDGVLDFDFVTRNPATGRLKDEYQAGDWLHLNRAGYAAMGRAVNLSMLLGKPK